MRSGAKIPVYGKIRSAGVEKLSSSSPFFALELELELELVWRWY